MKEPKISNLAGVTQEMINELEEWLSNKFYGDCPFTDLCDKTNSLCSKLFDNLKHHKYGCPCHIYGEEATALAFTIICDVWKVYHKRRKKNEHERKTG